MYRLTLRRRISSLFARDEVTYLKISKKSFGHFKDVQSEGQS